jgi:hypothetical protein
MCFCKTLPLLLLAGNALAAGDGYILGAGIQGDSTEGLAGTVVGSYGFSEKTWLSVGLARSSVDTDGTPDPETSYADVEIDQWFKPVGVRLGAAYWGDPDLLDSVDWRTSLYWRGDKASISGNFEYRDFRLRVPGTDLVRGRTLKFDANGFGAVARFNLSETVDLSLSGMKYDYSVDFRPPESRDTISDIPISRLGLISSMIDHRAKISLGIDHGLQRWQFDLSAWEGAIDGLQTTSASVSFLTPLSDMSDIEFSLGFDDSELYGDVSFFSVFLYFYGSP